MKQETVPLCRWEATSADECAMMRERDVAGKSDAMPVCPLHEARTR